MNLSSERNPSRCGLLTAIVGITLKALGYIHILWAVPGRGAACRRCGASKWCSSPSILSIEQTWRQDFLSNKVAYSVTRNTKHKSRQKKRAHIITPTENQESLHWRMSSTMWALCGILEACRNRIFNFLLLPAFAISISSLCWNVPSWRLGPHRSHPFNSSSSSPRVAKNGFWRSRHTPVDEESNFWIQSKLVKSAILSTRHVVGPTHARNSRILYASQPAVQEAGPDWWSQWLWGGYFRLW